MTYLITGIIFYFLGWCAGYAAGRTRKLTIPFYLLNQNGSTLIHTREVDWDEEFKKIKDQQNEK